MDQRISRLLKSFAALSLLFIMINCSTMKQTSGILIRKNNNAGNNATTLIFKTNDGTITSRTFLPDKYKIGEIYQVEYRIKRIE